MLRAALPLVLGLSSPLVASAQECVLPVHPGLIEQRQPDGSPIQLRFAGDAFGHWYEDEAGFAVVPSATGWCYATSAPDGSLLSSGALVGRADARALGLAPHAAPLRPARLLRPASQAGAGAQAAAPAPAPGSSGPRAFVNSTGTVKNLVVLLRFSNHGPSGQNRTLPTVTNVTTIMNAVGGDPVLAPTGSVRDHYLQDSYNQLAIESTVVGWIDLPNTETYYANGNSGLTSLTWDAITAGLAAADPLVDFSQFDVDGDGWIDAITFLHSGYGAEWGGTDQYGTNYVNRMWSHKWEIPPWTSAEGVKVSDYNISPGLWGISGSAPGRIGVVVHELGHYFGLPDLYDTDGTSQGIGNWDLMAAGSWGFDGSQQYPSHMSAWCKMKLGWLAPQRILPGAFVAPQVEFTPTVYRIDDGYPPGEYLLVENRQKTGFDLQLPQGGLCIWHVDEGKGSFTQNTPNNDEGYAGQSGWPTNGRHYRIALLQADGSFNLEYNQNRGDAADVYHGAGVNAIDNNTTPNTKAYQGGTLLSSGNRLQGIGNSSANVGFTFVNTSGPAISTATLPPASLGVAYSQTLLASGGTTPRTFSEWRSSPSYAQSDLGTQSFASGGTAQNWKADDNVWSLNLPFAFPYWETQYTKVYVSSNGFVDLAPCDAEAGNRPDWLRFSLRIAPLWDDLTTNFSGGNVFVDTSVSGQVRIRWAARTLSGNNDCNFALRLFSDGRMRFEYGSGNTGLTPTVGLSRGSGDGWLIPATHDSQASLTNAHVLEFAPLGSQLPPGLALSTSGVLSGTPTQGGTWNLRVRVTDSNWRYDEKLYTLSVNADCNGNGIPDPQDISSGTSQDCDANGIPDECQPDSDGDHVPNVCDGCPNDPLKIAPGQCGCGIADTDSDGDGTANCHDGCPNDPLKTAPGVCGCGVADTDSDGDGTPNCNDLCPNDPLKIAPGQCGCGIADTDSDADGTANCHDGCPNDPLKTAPGVCGCGVADTDSDGDGTPNCNDGCPNDPLKTAPGVCGCGVADTDSDGDGTPNCNDLCPNDPLKIEPGVCGCGVADTDSDGDGTANCNDQCPNDPLKTAPGACGCGVADTDSDGDGTANCHDGCPNDPLKTAPGVCGCGVADTDSDGDGTANCNDLCPNDPLKIAPGVCGCGVADTDSDGDGTPNCSDLCPNDPLKIAPGVCGCGVADTDSDGDGTPNCNDLCPNDPLKVSPGQCGCGVADTDSDGDGTANCNDQCPSDPQKTAPGVCGCGVADTDSDGDGVADCVDNCPSLPNTSQADCDSDGIGDVCEIALGAPDCNANTIPDACEIASGQGTDLDGNGVLDTCELVGTPFCFGDGSAAACPCNNSGASGNGCANSSQSSGARLTALGALSPDDLTLVATHTLPNSLSIFLQGDTAIAPAPFGDGLRCTGGLLKRIAVKSAVNGAVIYPQGSELGVRARSAQLGDTIPSNALRHYQTYYRDPSATFCPNPPGNTWNVTNGVSVLWP